MAVVGQRTFSFGIGKYFNLANEDFVRLLPFGNSWTSLRIGVLVGIDNQTAANMGGAWPVIGVCSGTSSPFGSPTCLNFVGWAVATSALTFTYNAGGGLPYYTTASNQAVVTKRNGVLGASSTNGTSMQWPVAAWTPRRSVLIITITKGSPNYATSSAYAPAAMPDWTNFNFLDMMDQQVSTPICAGVTLSASAIGNAAMDEVPGPLNAVNISWNRQAFPMEIYALAVARVS